MPFLVKIMGSVLLSYFLILWSFIDASILYIFISTSKQLRLDGSFLQCFRGKSNIWETRSRAHPIGRLRVRGEAYSVVFPAGSKVKCCVIHKSDRVGLLIDAGSIGYKEKANLSSQGVRI